MRVHMTCSHQNLLRVPILPYIVSTAIITEADAGSDASMARSSAIRDGDAYIILAGKVFDTNGILTQR